MLTIVLFIIIQVLSNCSIYVKSLETCYSNLKISTNWESASYLNDSYQLSWNIDNKLSTISIFMSVNSINETTWVGFGISEAGHMLGSDIVSVSYINEEFTVDDRYVPWVGYPFTTSPSLYPELDNQNDWTLICADKSSNSFRALVVRALDTNDNQDRAITTGYMPVIYAYGNSYTDSVSYHQTMRGTSSILFIGEITTFPPIDTDEKLTFVYDTPFTTVGLDTNYICQSFDLGTETRHVVAIEAYLNSPVASYAHHLVVHSCGNVFYDTLVEFHWGKAMPCQSDDNTVEGDSPLGTGLCESIIGVWALGSGPITLPDSAGFLIGESSTRYIVLEYHINNPEKNEVELVDLGVNIYTTSTLREYNTGAIILGDGMITFGSPIPLGEDSVHYESTCVTGCTSSILLDPVYIYASLLHMHSYGKEMWTNIQRFENNIIQPIDYDNIEYLDKRQFWNNGYQIVSSLNITINPGDQLNTHCTYDTSKRSDDLLFGLSSYDEMCLHFLFIYPINNVIEKFANVTVFCGYDHGRSLCGPTGQYKYLKDNHNPIPDGLTTLPDSDTFGL